MWRYSAKVAVLCLTEWYQNPVFSNRLLCESGYLIQIALKPQPDIQYGHLIEEIWLLLFTLQCFILL